jgi:hypothetical protein
VRSSLASPGERISDSFVICYRRAIRGKAGNENVKVDEVLFINTLNAGCYAHASGSVVALSITFEYLLCFDRSCEAHSAAKTSNCGSPDRRRKD